MIRFPYSRPCLDPRDIDAAVAVLRDSAMLTQGPEVDAFEAALSDYLEGVEVVCCNSGTAALHLAYAALGLGPDRGLVTSPVTFLATANAARFLDAPVAFCDVDPATGLMSPSALEALLSDPPFPVAAVCLIHLAGCADAMPVIAEICDRFGVAMVEDACHALGAVYPGGKRVGSGSADFCAFSFHAIKHIAVGEGGAVTTRDRAAAERMRAFRSHGITRNTAAWRYPPDGEAPWYYEMDQLGFNYRLTDFQCSLARSQLSRLDEANAQRRTLIARYEQNLSDKTWIYLPSYLDGTDRHSWHLFQVAIDFAGIGRPRGAVMLALRERGVGTQVHYIPLTHQPYYRALGAVTPEGAATFYDRTLSLPLYPQMTVENVDEICSILTEVVAK